MKNAHFVEVAKAFGSSEEGKHPFIYALSG